LLLNFSDKTDPHLLPRLGIGLRLRRQLQNAGRLAFGQQREQQDAPIRKLKRIMMRRRLFFVDLAEDRRLMAT
jgi:hypothetical protein